VSGVDRREPTGRCPSCGRPTYGGATHCRARTCPAYGPLWARDQQRKLFENLEAYSEGDGHAVMLTVTAPGAAQLAWSSHCEALGPHRHDGRLGCRVEPLLAAAWNESCSSRWRRLHDRAARLTVAECGRRPRLLARAFEMQHRGVLHAHAVVGRGKARDKRTSDVYARHVRRLAGEYGFGFVDAPLGRARRARESAAYLSAYLRGKGHKQGLSETVRSHEMPRSIIHVSVTLTMATGCTMRALRFRRLVWVRWGVALDFKEQRSVLALMDAFPGSTLERGPPDPEVVTQRFGALSNDRKEQRWPEDADTTTDTGIGPAISSTRSSPRTGEKARRP
jgi:hypothetical protein